MKSYEFFKNSINAAIEQNKEELFELNKWIFDKHELSNQEFETSAKLVDYLNSKGFKTEYPFMCFPTAFFAEKESGKAHSHKLAILTEYDALPEVGHACGHCLSCCISLLAAMALVPLQDELDLDIHIIGTPGEETDGAKGHMADMGLFDGYDMAMMVHLNDYNMTEPDVKALSSFEYSFHGRSAHSGSAPWEGRNALNAAQLFFHAIDMMRQHMKPDSRVHGIYTNGGAAPNIVPDEASVFVYIRALKLKDQQDLIRRVDLCAEGAAIATECSWDKIAPDHIYEPLKKNKTGAELLREIYDELGLPLDSPDNNFGSTDAGNVSQVCPTFHPLLQVADHGITVHQQEFAACMKTEKAFEALQNGARIIALQSVRVFSDKEVLEAVKADFAAE